MQNKHSIYTILILLFLLISSINGLSQKLITYKADNQPLNSVLTTISSISKVRFAFDDDYFSKIYVSFNVRNLTAEDFLKQLSAKFPVNYRLIGGTWVVYKDEKKVEVMPKPIVEPQKPVEPPPIIAEKIVYKKARLWDIIGNVIDTKSGNRLRFCQLYIDEYTKPFTNEAGYFKDEFVSTGDVRIKVNQMGYYPLDTTFVLADGKEIILKLNPVLKIENKNFDSYSGIFQIKQPETTELIALNAQSGTYMPGIDHNDFINSLQTIPGFHLSEDDDAAISTRGTSPSQNLIMIDGIPVLNNSHLSGQVSTINSKFIHQSFVSRGGFGVEYGGASSGIIELTGKTAKNTIIDFSANLLDANLFVGIPVSPKLSVSGSFRKSIVDFWPNYYYKNLVLVPLLLKSAGDIVITEKGIRTSDNFYDINLKVAYRPTTRSEVDFIISNGSDNQTRNFSIEADKPYFIDNQTKLNNYGFGLNWKFKSKNSWYNTVIASYNQLNQNRYFNSGFYNYGIDTPGLHLSEFDLSNSSEALLKWKSEFSRKKLSYQFGAEYNFNHLHYNYNGKVDEFSGTTGDSISEKLNKHQGNLFFESKYKVLSWIELTAGIRGLVDISMPAVFIQPRAGINLIPDNEWRFYYRFGKYIQPFYQTQRVRVDLNLTPVLFLSTEKDMVLKTFHHVFGINYNREGLFLNLEAYRIKSTGRAAYFELMKPEIHSEGENYRIHSGSSVHQGVDALIRYNHSRFTHSLAYSFSDATEKFDGVNGGNYYTSLANYRNRLQFNETVSFSGWVASASFKFMTGKPYLLKNSTLEQFNLSKLPAFSQLDISLVKQFSFKKLKMEAGAVLLNILNTKNVKNIQFIYPVGSSSNFTIQSTTSGISFTPTLFIDLKFN